MGGDEKKEQEEGRRPATEIASDIAEGRVVGDAYEKT